MPMFVFGGALALTSVCGCDPSLPRMPRVPEFSHEYVSRGYHRLGNTQNEIVMV